MRHRSGSHEYGDPSCYWEGRLQRQFNLVGVGYGSLGPRYNRRMYQARSVSLDRALAKVGRTALGASVGDVGCGSGFYAEYFESRGAAEYMGLDIAPTSVRILRGRFPQFRFELLDVTTPQQGLLSSLDLVLAADVLFHIVEDNKFEAALGNMTSWLAVGGLLVASDIFADSTVQPAAHVKHRSRAQYESYLSAFGLSVLHVEPIFAVLHPPTPLAGLHPIWGLYVSLWRRGWRIARLAPADIMLPRVLGWLDRVYMLERIGLGAPTPKWLVAGKANAS